MQSDTQKHTHTQIFQQLAGTYLIVFRMHKITGLDLKPPAPNPLKQLLDGAEGAGEAITISDDEEEGEAGGEDREPSASGEECRTWTASKVWEGCRRGR